MESPRSLVTQDLQAILTGSVPEHAAEWASACGCHCNFHFLITRMNSEQPVLPHVLPLTQSPEWVNLIGGLHDIGEKEAWSELLIFAVPKMRGCPFYEEWVHKLYIYK